MNSKPIRTGILFVVAGLAWYVMMQLYFVRSGAQNILANPAYQSGKFLEVFMQLKPLPRMATEPNFVLMGFFVCGIFLAGAFLIINSWMSGGWVKRGLLFGLIQWLLMAPWFEFYLPYNVMCEPLLLVLFEGLLWLATSISTALILSFIVNFNFRSNK